MDKQANNTLHDVHIHCSRTSRTIHSAFCFSASAFIHFDLYALHQL